MLKTEKNIAIYETRLHPIYLYTMMRILKDENRKVIVFTSKMNYSVLEYFFRDGNIKEFTFYLKDDNENINSFLGRISREHFKHLDSLFINTIQGGIFEDFFPFVKNKLPKKVFLTLHNPKKWARFEGSFTVKNILLYLFKKIILLKTKYIVFVSQKLLDNSSKYFIKSYNRKKMLYIPFALPEDDIIQVQKTTDLFHIVIPGQIDSRRRDYNSIFELLDTFNEEDKNRYKITLLGRLANSCKKEDDDFLERIKRYQKERININTPEGVFISQKKYEETIVTSNILLGIGNTTLYDNDKETGIVYDAIRYCLPLIINQGLGYPEDISSSVLKYSNTEELRESLSSSYHNYAMIYNKAVLNSKKYSIKRFKEETGKYVK